MLTCSPDDVADVSLKKKKKKGRTLSRQYGVSGRKVQALKARLAPGLTCRQVDLSPGELIGR